MRNFIHKINWESGNVTFNSLIQYTFFNALHSSQIKIEHDRLFPDHGKKCYRAACYETTRLLAAPTELPEGKYSVSFQSRLSRNWLSPFTDETIIRLAEEGNKKILVAAPSFVTDCLETRVEIGMHLSELFRKHGGEKLCLVESLNTMSSWVDALAQMVAENGSSWMLFE